MRVLMSFYENKESEQLMTKVKEGNTFTICENQIFNEFPNAVITYSNIITNGGDGAVCFGKGMLLCS